MAVAYKCGDLPGMAPCPAEFTTDTEAELWEHIAVHARRAHNIDSSSMPPEIKNKISSLFRRLSEPASDPSS
ncbi:MAG: DUF1059 domain-containing protein [Chloroflexi bacterium]|uniref:DUF1059 domain-containing protein n=1 Tax=Candidatus Flexifilum breve TaxID=3140694 RepID=UPI003135F1A2|nr:DUF1059 domain-containing protein [Chloroflexota bacterium]